MRLSSPFTGILVLVIGVTLITETRLSCVASRREEWHVDDPFGFDLLSTLDLFSRFRTSWF